MPPHSKLWSLSIGAALVVALSVSVVSAAPWTGPTQAPPAGNTPTPINVGSDSQYKAGGFQASVIASDNIIMGTQYCFQGPLNCITSWTGAGPWTLAGADIYYSGGKVGIGTAAPVATLDVNGYARLAPQSSAPVACDAAHKGSIAVTNAGRLCVCDGAAWIFDYNAAACTWGSADTTPPTVALTAPANGATVSGTISVTATASDNVAVVGVQFKLDGANLGTEDTTSPYSTSWNTTTASNGSHTLTAVARDAAGNTTTSASRTVTVSNAPPVSPGSQTFSTPGTYSFTVPAYNTLTVQVWGGGGGGSGAYFGSTAGGSSRFGSTVIAGGGGAGENDGGGGTASGGSTNTSGGDGSYTQGGNSPNGGTGGQPGESGDSTGNPPGGGGGPLGEGVGQGGGGGAYVSRTYSAGQLSGSVTVVVGAGGNGDNASWNGSFMGGGDGANGRVYITWN